MARNVPGFERGDVVLFGDSIGLIVGWDASYGCPKLTWIAKSPDCIDVYRDLDPTYDWLVGCAWQGKLVKIGHIEMEAGDGV